MCSGSAATVLRLQRRRVPSGVPYACNLRCPTALCRTAVVPPSACSRTFNELVVGGGVVQLAVGVEGGRLGVAVHPLHDLQVLPAGGAWARRQVAPGAGVGGGVVLVGGGGRTLEQSYMEPQRKGRTRLRKAPGKMRLSPLTALTLLQMIV